MPPERRARLPGLCGHVKMLRPGRLNTPSGSHRPVGMRPDGIALFADQIDHLRQDLSIGRTYRVQQHNLARMQKFLNPRAGRRGIRLVVRVPIVVGKAPEQALVAHLLHQSQRLLGKFPLREAEKPHFIAEVFPQVVLHPNRVGGGILDREVFAVNLVAVRVVSEDMSLVDHPLYQLGLAADIMSGEKKDRPHPLLFESVQNRSGIAVLIALIKGQGYGLFVLGADKAGVILAKPILQAGAGGRTAQVVLEWCRGPISPARSRACRSQGSRRSLPEPEDQGQARIPAPARSFPPSRRQTAARKVRNIVVRISHLRVRN